MTDGNTVYVATVGGNPGQGIWKTTVGSTSISQYVTSGDFTVIRWVNQRIMAAGTDSTMYNIVAAGPTPAPLYTHPSDAWRWTDFTYGSSQIYCSGGIAPYGPSGIFRTTPDPTDSTVLIVPVQALPLENGEYPTCLGSYLNYVFVGTNLGLRMCQTLAAYDPTGNQGDLRAGAIIPNITQPVTQPVTGIIGDGRFVYFTWNDYDSDSTGLGRLDLENFIDALTPTYASDLMIPGSGSILLSWDPVTNSPLMSVQGQQGIDSGGIYTMDTQHYVSEGFVDSGYTVFDLPDDKVAMSMVGQVLPPQLGTVEGQLSVDQPLMENYRSIGVQAAPQSSIMNWDIPQTRGSQFQVRFILESSDDRTGSPTLSHWTLKAYAAVSTGIMISVVLIMDRLTVEKDLLRPFDPYAEYDYLEECRQDQRVIQYVEGPFVRNGIITQLDWLPNLEQFGGPWTGYQSYLIVYFKTLPGAD